jgi:ATP-dependent Clp protease adapter protein ClpS
MAKETGDANDAQDFAQAEERLSKRGRRVQTIEKIMTKDEETLLRQKHSLLEDEPIMYRVILHDDQCHTFPYVVQSLVKVVGVFTRATAYEMVVEAHRHNKSTVICVWKEKAQNLCLGLQRQGLTVSIVPDYEFERRYDSNNDSKKNKNKKMSPAELTHEINK